MLPAGITSSVIALCSYTKPQPCENTRVPARGPGHRAGLREARWGLSQTPSSRQACGHPLQRTHGLTNYPAVKTRQGSVSHSLRSLDSCHGEGTSGGGRMLSRIFFQQIYSSPYLSDCEREGPLFALVFSRACRRLTAIEQHSPVWGDLSLLKRIYSSLNSA